jgi:hypothetical protein
MNSHLEAFIREARNIAESRGIPWDLELDAKGIVIRDQAWNLTQIVGASPPPTTWLNDLGTDRRTVEVLNCSPPSGPQRKYSKTPLSSHWQELIKACVIDQSLVRRNTCDHVESKVARPLRVLATCCAKAEPWAITVDDVAFAIATARKVQKSGKLADVVYGVVRSVLDPNHLTDYGPLSPALERDKKFSGRTSKFTKSTDELRSDLEERKRAEKLPEKRAFWELARIVFTETPRTFVDLLRFAQAKTLIFTGLRAGECNLLPADWKRHREYFDLGGRSAHQTGGVGRSLMLRHFAEKQRGINEDSIALFETVQHVPHLFEEVLTMTLDQVVAKTDPLRRTLQRQIETGRILPQFEKTDLIRAPELYTHLTGNPFVARCPEYLRQKFVTTYQRDYNPDVFNEIHTQQLDAIGAGRELCKTAYRFLGRFIRVSFRKANGDIWKGRKIWAEIYIRVDEAEEFLKNELPMKRSDLTPIKLSDGELSVWELLFLMPKFAQSGTEDAGLCDITRYCAVGRMDRSMITLALSTGKQTLFSVYGENDEDRALTLRPHSLRHLQNTELFRLGIADTIITKRFNRRKVAQSYDYDHRSLAEELDRNELKPEVEASLGEKSATIARMIKSGKARGPIVEAFNRIQLTDGEDAAFDYLNAEADGFHSTPYGHCINSFMVDPCPKHLECFTGCKHLSATDLSENRLNLVQLEARLETAVHAVETRKLSRMGPGSSPQLEAESDYGASSSGDLQVAAKSIEKRISSIGLDNQLAHAKTRLEGVRMLLATPPGQLVFPDGPDLSKDPAKPKGRVLDEFN